MDLRCKKCNHFIIELDFDARSSQDFVVRRDCPKCGLPNGLHVQITSGPARSIAITNLAVH